ncbi:MAG: AAA family ATPase, partial [Candidatus Bathyarchaeia archaeon]
MAVAGKGGVGKTLIAGSLARLLARDGYRVLAIDADPAMNLHRQLGIDSRMVEYVKPILEDSKLIDERVNIGSGLLLLTPRVDDIIERYGVEGRDNVTLVRLGTIRYG